MGELSQDIRDTKSEGINLLLVAGTKLAENNKEEASRLCKIAQNLLKETGDAALTKEASEMYDFVRDYDPKGKAKEEAKKATDSGAQSQKTDYTLVFDYGKTTGVIFDSFIA